jgi:hypothetical protein
MALTQANGQMKPGTRFHHQNLSAVEGNIRSFDFMRAMKALA